MSDYKETARKVVAEWFIRLWVKRPDWLTKFPDDEATADLTKAVSMALQDSFDMGYRAAGGTITPINEPRRPIPM